MHKSNTNPTDTNDSKKKPCPNEQIRKRAKNCHRICEGIRQLRVKKWKNIFIALWTTALVIVLSMTGRFSEYISGVTIIDLLDSLIIAVAGVQILHEIVVAVVLLLFALLLLGILYLLGIPPKARQIERDIAIAMFPDKCDYKRTFLISARPIANTDMTDYHFYAKWLNEADFRKVESNILTALDCHRVEGDYMYGGKNGMDRKIIVIRAGVGKNPSDKGVLYDE